MEGTVVATLGTLAEVWTALAILSVALALLIWQRRTEGARMERRWRGLAENAGLLLARYDARGRLEGSCEFDLGPIDPRSGPREIETHDAAGGTRWFLAHSMPRLSRSDALEGYDVVGIDITERREAEMALRRRDEQLRFIFDNTRELLYVQELPSGRFQSISPSCRHVTGYAPAEFAEIHDDILLLDHPASRGYAPRTERPPPDSTGLEPYTVAIRHGDGTPRILQVHETEVVRDGRWLLVGVAVDVTEIHRAAEAMLHSEKLKSLGVVAGGIAHDFNNLLVGVIGNAELALRHVAPESRAHPLLEGVRAAGQRAAELCRQLLAYAGKGQFELADHDLSALVEEMLALVQVSVPRAVTMEVLLDRELPPVRGDAAQLRQVIMNLITNAAESIGTAPGRIRIRTGALVADRDSLRDLRSGNALEPGRYVYLEVADTGSGMDAATLPRIFEPFFTTKFAGRGLGLAAAAGIVSSHRGGLLVRSEPDEGSTFRLLLPPVAVGEGPPCVLVVGPGPELRSRTGRTLRAAGYEVVDSESVTSAAAMLTHGGGRIAAVLIGALESRDAARLRAMRPDVPIVVCDNGPEAPETLLERLSAALRAP